jgi:4-hydroxybenzoyl-CoA reductase subunit beta
MGTLGGNLNVDTRCFYYNQSAHWRSCKPTCLKAGGDQCNAVGGGKKCFAVHSGDVAPALISLGATATLRSADGGRTVAVEELYTGDGVCPISVNSGEMVTEVTVPPGKAGTTAFYLKYRRRKSIDFPMGALAAVVSAGSGEAVCESIRLVTGGVSSGPQVLDSVSAYLEGKTITTDVVEQAVQATHKAVRPVDNVVGATPAQRRLMVKSFVHRVLEETFPASAL